MATPAQAVPVAAEAQAPQGFLALCSPGLLWDSLVNGTSNPVQVFDAHGRIVFANAPAAAEYSRSGRSTVVGANLTDVTPAEYAAEWQGFLRRALQSRRPLIVEGMVHGTKYRANLHPVGDADSGYVLVITRVAPDLGSEAARPGAEVVQAKANDLGQLADLTERELEVLELVGEGLSTAEIARRLDRSVKTVEWHRAALGSKLGITNRVELARIAISAGLCSPKGNRRKGDNGAQGGG